VDGEDWPIFLHEHTSQSVLLLRSIDKLESNSCDRDTPGMALVK